ncbi:unnamed protein product [Ascophyllum nodosum]
MHLAFAVLACVFGLSSATREGRGVGGWLRRPVAVGALSGIRFGQEPHLLEFHGANCDHCDAMVPLMRKLFNLYKIQVKRHMVWEGTANFRLMAAYDMETGCKGLPFFYNRRTNKAICGATTWENFKDWAFSRDCFAFLPPTPTAQEEEEAKPKKLAQDSLFEKLKSRAQGKQKPKPPAAEGEYGE